VGGPDPTAERLTAICRALPEVEVAAERQHTSYSVRGRRFAWHLVDHHGDGRVALHCRAARGENEALAGADPGRFFLPPYLARHGWVGLYLDVGAVDWGEVRALVVEAYRMAAPKRLAAGLE
jgi:hypothetical protein